MIEFNKALIIDDDIDIADIIEPILEEIGFISIQKIIKSADIQKIYKDDIDLIVLDLFMPDMDGVEILRYLGEKNSKSHIILVSGHSKQVLLSAEHVAKAYGLNILGTITKPFSIDVLFELIRKFNEIPDREKKFTIPAAEFTSEFFREAFSENYFQLYYQPQLDLKKKEVIGFESLIRINHPKFGLLFPDQFLPNIEKLGLMTEMTMFVITKAISFLGELKKKGYEKSISINVSILDLLDTSLPEQIDHLAKKYDIYPKFIMIELIETGKIGNNPRCLEILTRLSMKGFSLSIDDFGTGYSSLEQLVNAPFDELKIDRSFVLKISDKIESRTIIESVVALAHKINLSVVAEGIETKEIAGILADLGVDKGQGYFFSVPLPELSVESYLTNFIFA